MANVVRHANRIYVNSLPWTVNPQKLKAYFSKFGNVTLSTVLFDKNTGFSRGFGFIKFANELGYRSALNEKRHYIDGALIRANPSKHKIGQ